PPTPSEDHFAYVGTDTWPKEMESAVISLRGTTCAAPGCFQNYSVLVHRRPVKLGGRTSVDNLVPLCAAHAQAKGDRDYDEWVATLKAGEAVSRSEPEAESLPFGKGLQAAPPRPVSNTVLIASSAFGGRGAADSTTEGWHVRAPFLHLGINRLLFDYDWRVVPGKSGRILFAAWPADEHPDPALVGTDTYDGPVQEKQHSSAEGSSGSSRLELVLPTSHFGRWLAVVRISGEGLSIGDYVLLGTD
ncbi:MAG: HNH endonuclease signature motif containing protein, partial [candidate division WOR-3 bacterium]